MNREHRGRGDRDAHRVEVFIRIVGDFVVQGRVDDDVGWNNEYGVAVGCCPCPLTHADIAASTAYVLDVELFPEMLGQTLRNQAAEYIRRTTGRVGNDHTYGSRWIGLRLRKPRQGPDLDERQKGEIRWAEAVTLLTARDDDDAFAEMRRHFSEEQIVELTVFCGMWKRRCLQLLDLLEARRTLVIRTVGTFRAACGRGRPQGLPVWQKVH